MCMAASVKDYPTPAPIVDAIRKPLLAGRHLIILNTSGHSESLVSEQEKRPRDRKCIRPLYPLDHKNVSAERTLELILSAMGKSIL